MATKSKLESAHETVNTAQTVLDAADKSLHVAEKATEAASKAKSKTGLLILVAILALLGIYLAKRNQT
jgi:hypothetical protein